MKRRSPWLTFAACALMGGSALSEPGTSRGKTYHLSSISAAALVAEAELERRGLAPAHFISSLVLVRPGNRLPFYLVRVLPRVLPKGSLSKAEELSFQVTMDGQVSEVWSPNNYPAHKGQSPTG
jgi:hypothetical protein